MMAKTLCEHQAGERGRRVMVVTPKPVTWIAGELRNAVKRELAAQDARENAEKEATDPKEATEKELKDAVRACLDRVMLSQVFDIDGLWEVLAELDEPDKETDDEPAGAAQTIITEEETRAPLLEVQDSQDEDGSPIPIPDFITASPTRQSNATTQRQPRPEGPSVILITHFSSLLTSLFTHREKSAAHSLLQLLSSRLRYLSRTLPTQPLFLLLNSTATSDDASTKKPPPPQGGGGGRERKPLDATLRSVFNPPDLPVRGYEAGAHAVLARRNKPTFGMVFSQLLDVHLLCTRSEAVTIVEVLLDEMGVWEGKMGTRKGREQRWGTVRVDRGGRLVNGLEEGEKRVYEDVRIVAGFGGPRV